MGTEPWGWRWFKLNHHRFPVLGRVPMSELPAGFDDKTALKHNEHEVPSWASRLFVDSNEAYKND